MSSSTNTYLTPVKSVNFNISEFVGATYDPCFAKGYIETKPTIYKTGNSFYFDYSNSANSSDLKYLKRFFGNLGNGNTFSIVGGTYYVEESGQQYNFLGTYTLVGSTGEYNQYINLSGVTYPVNIADGVYYSKNFLNEVKYTASSGNTAQYYQVKLNKDDPFNLDFFGIYGNDYGYQEYLEISGSTLNAGRYLLNSFVKLNDGSQIAYINSSSSIANENLYFRPVIATVYMRGVPDIVTLSQNKNLNGLIKKINSSGDVLKVFDKQNLHQRYCRSITDTDSYFDWYAGQVSEYNQNIYNPQSYTALSLSINYFSFVKIVVNVVNDYNTVLADNTFLQTNVISLAVDGVVTSTANYQSQLLSNSVLKLDLSDASLYSATIEPFLDAACSQRLTQNYFLNGIPGFDGASFIYLKTNSAPSTFYLKFTTDVSLILQVVI